MGWSDRVKTIAIVEELMKECGYNGSPRPGLPSAWKLRHFIHEDNDKIWVYIMDDSNTSIRLWREPNMYTEKTRSQAFRARVASSKVIDLTDPNSLIEIKKFFELFRCILNYEYLTKCTKHVLMY